MLQSPAWFLTLPFFSSLIAVGPIDDSPRDGVGSYSAGEGAAPGLAQVRHVLSLPDLPVWLLSLDLAWGEGTTGESLLSVFLN